MRRWPAAAVAALLVGLISTPGVTATTSNQRVVREAVVTTTAPDGTPQSTLVSQLVQLSSKDGTNVSLRMPKVSDLSSYRNLSGFSGPSGNSKAVVWHTTGSINAQALAKINRKLPFEVHVTYFLNGKEVKPSQVDGKDGRLKIQLELVNASGDPKNLSYNGLTSPYLSGTVEEYIPFEYAVRIAFPQNQWTGITGSRFDVAPLGSDQVAAATGVISPPLTQVSDTIDVSAHSTDMLRPHIEVFAFPKINPNLLGSLQTQYEALQALYGGTGDISANLGKLYDGTLQLVDGLQQFLGGTGQLNGGIDQIVAGVGTNDPKTGKPNIVLDKNGTPTTLIGGIGTIADALTSAVLPGIGTRDPATGKPVITLSGGTPTTVFGAIGTIDDAIRSAILPAVGTRDPVTGKGVITLDSLGNTTTLLGGLQSQKNAYDNSLIPGAQKAACGINAIYSFCTKGAASLTSGVQQIRGGVSLVNSTITQLLSKLQTNSPNPKNFGFVEGLAALQGGLTQTVAGLEGGSGAQQGLLNITTALAGILTSLGSSDPAIASALNDIHTGLTAAVGRLDGADVRTGLVTVQTGLAGLLTSVAAVKAKVTDIHQEATDGLLLPDAIASAPVTANLTLIQTNASDALTALGDTSTAASVLGQIQAAKNGVDSVLSNLGTSGGSAADIIPTIEAINTSVAALITTLGSGSATLVATVQAVKDGVDQILGAVGRMARVATTVALPAYTRTANVITAAANGALPKIDAVSLAAADRLLLKNGAAGEDNGIYQVTSLGSASTPFVLTRTSDANTSAVVTHGMLVSISEGSTLAGTTWALATANPITLNTTALTFVQSPASSFLGGAKLMLAGVNLLIAGLGTTTGAPNGATVIGALELLQNLVLGPTLVGIDTGLLPGLGALGAGVHNAAWDKPQKELNGIINAKTTPHQLYSVCPGCFDATFTNYDASKGILLPNGQYVKPGLLHVLRTDPRFQPGLLEAFHLFSDGIRDALPKLVSLDPTHPGLVDGLTQIAVGLETLSAHLQTFNPKDPGLVDGLQLIVAGLKTLGSKLQTFDPSHPGLVDGLQLVQGGIGQLNTGAQQLHSGGQQISQGVFAIDQLGLRVIHGQVGDQGDTVAQDQATLNDALAQLGGRSTLAKADAVSTTYVFETPASSTAMRDNLVRGTLIALLIALLGLMARRPSMLGL